MNTRKITRDVLRRLRAKARTWWYHAQLRERGQIAEAVKREKESIRSSVRSILQADYVLVSEDRYSYYASLAPTETLNGGGSLSGYDRRGEGWPGAAEVAGVPIIVSSDVPEDKRVSFALRLPVWYFGDEREGHLGKVFAHARKYGARILNAG